MRNLLGTKPSTRTWRLFVVTATTWLLVSALVGMLILPPLHFLLLFISLNAGLLVSVIAVMHGIEYGYENHELVKTARTRLP